VPSETKKTVRAAEGRGGRGSCVMGFRIKIVRRQFAPHKVKWLERY